MLAYIIRRLLLIPITLTGIFMTSFLLINFAPGGPLEALIAEMQGISTDLGDRMIGSDGDVGEANTENTDGSVGKSVNDVEGYTGREGLDPERAKLVELGESVGDELLDGLLLALAV